MASTVSTGFRGPAKRAAFGDVTNVAKNVGSGANTVKMVKPFAGTFSQPSTAANLNKENVSFASKGFSSQPAQKPALQPSRAASEPESRPLGAVKRPATSASHDFPSLHNETIEEETVAALGPHDQVEDDSIPPQVPLHSTRLQPRQHKSQPDLKARKQTLRRTQSRIIERPQTVEEAPEGDLASLDDLELPLPHADISSHLESAEVASMETIVAVDMDRAEPVSAMYDDQVPDDDSDAAFLDQILGRDQGSLPARSEPDECWAEEEDDYYEEETGALDILDETTGIPAVLHPKVTGRVQRELEDAKLEVQRTRTFDDIEEETWDVSMVAEYGDEIFEYMRELEVRTRLTDVSGAY